METHEPQQCQTTIPGTTIFLTRYEYCNLYHTTTDWWNTFFALPTLDSAKFTHFVFLDAHPQGSLDAVWGFMFANVTYVQHLPKGGVCFEKAVLVPPGYMAQLWPRHTFERGGRKQGNEGKEQGRQRILSDTKANQKVVNFFKIYSSHYSII
jgi:hypothetical protein